MVVAQRHVKFPVFTIFPCVFLRTKMNIFYFLNGLHHLLNHNLNLKIIHFPCLVQISCDFIKFFKFPEFSLYGKIDNQIPRFPLCYGHPDSLH